MTKWEYGLAYYIQGTIEAHPEYMNDLQGLGQRSIAHFLHAAGERGWELCTLLPHEDVQQPACLVFKRPFEDD
jgi:hypothetical protein